MQSHEKLCNILQIYANFCKIMRFHDYSKFLMIIRNYSELFVNIFILAAPFDRIEEEADEDIAGDLGEDPPPRASAPPLSEGVRHAAAEPMPRAIAAAAEVPSERFLGESRREQLKRKAAPLSRSLCEAFSFVTSKTMSIKDTRNVIQTFGNVS